jgi:hypothetical protein
MLRLWLRLIWPALGLLRCVRWLTHAHSQEGCPFDCNGHGTCDTETYTCLCDERWTGDYCKT